jgi:Fic family protein
MLFTTPELGEAELRVIAEIDDLREKTRVRLHEPRRWTGSLRREQFARAVQGSNSIEGFDAKLDDALAIEMGEPPLDASDETTMAIKGYRDAMTYVLQLADEPRFHFGEQLIKSLHFMMTGYSLKNRPGRWRIGSSYVRNDDTGAIVYEGPEVEIVADLIHELVRQLEQDNDTRIVVRAAMAHLNLVMVHPFRDGNGRMARCLQTLVLARDGILSPVFCSIEEYLGRNTQSYYDILAQTGGGSWHPERDARPWLRYILTAHVRQARTVLRRTKESERLWSELDQIVSRHGYPERVMLALYDAASGLRVRNGVYRAFFEETEDEISEQVASRDLRHLTDAGLLVAHGERRGRFYTAGQPLRDIQQAIIATRNPRDESDPFAPVAA